MKKRVNTTSKYLILIAAFLLLVNVILGFLLIRQSDSAMITLMHTRMLDISNTAASMLDGDVLKTVSPADEGTPGYDAIMRTLTHFQDNIDLQYIYCIRDMGDGTFTFGLDPTVEDPGEFGSPIVYTDALYQASLGIASADDKPYKDAWGTFYSAYSPVFDSKGEVAGIVAVDFGADWYEDQLAVLNRITIIIAAISLVVGVGIVALIMSRHRKQIHEVDEQLEQLATNLTKGLSSTTVEELHESEKWKSLERGHMDSLTGKLEMIIEAEKKESHIQQKKLSDALLAAQQANVAKSIFLSNMSHEIRTPLNAIIGLDNLALKEPELPESTKEQLEKIGISAHHLLNIINDILDMSMIESGKAALRSEEFSTSELLDEINAVTRTQCQEKGLEYDFRINGTLSDYYIGDLTKLTQILLNILTNAVQYTPAPGKVEFVAETAAEGEDHSTLRFIVKDTGIGMDEEFLPRLFDSFSQEDSTIADQSGSTGLGLAISRNLLDLMNGTIEVKSEKGVGSIFTITVTLRNSDRDIPVSTPDSEISPEVAEEVDLSGLRILVVEDLEINAEIIIDLLEMEGMEAEHAENGQIAVDLFLQNEPGYYDAILMDLRMPVLDGLGASMAIRSSNWPDAKTIPIIAVTANAFDEDVRRSMQAGINVHLSKPVNADELYTTLAEQTRRKKNKPAEDPQAPGENA